MNATVFVSESQHLAVTLSNKLDFFAQSSLRDTIYLILFFIFLHIDRCAKK